jgi:hypothetical protein
MQSDIPRSGRYGKEGSCQALRSPALGRQQASWGEAGVGPGGRVHDPPDIVTLWASGTGPRATGLHRIAYEREIRRAEGSIQRPTPLHLQVISQQRHMRHVDHWDEIRWAGSRSGISTCR